MQNSLVTQSNQQGQLEPYSREWVDLVKRNYAVGATDDELKLFLYQCQKAHLDPLAKQIYFQKRRNNKTGKDNMTIITGIDGYRLVADRTGYYAGSDDPIFDNEAEPNKATVTVYKMVGGVRCAFTATARWSEYYPGEALGFMWKKMPCTMLGKCAEALALRKAFPQELSGMYVKEEMDQAGRPDAPVPGPATPVTATIVEGSKPAPKGKTVTMGKPAPTGTKYDNNNVDHQKAIAAKMAGKVDEMFWDEIGAAMHGKTFDDLRTVADEVVAALQAFKS